MISAPIARSAPQWCWGSVSMFSIGERIEEVECTVVVIKGRDVIQCFREWAERNKVLTPGKDVES